MNDSHEQTGPQWPTVGLAGRLVANENGGSLITTWVLLNSSDNGLVSFTPTRSCQLHQPLISLTKITFLSRSAWACRLHHFLTYSRHFALLIQRTAEMQTGGGSPVRQRRSAASSSSEWEQILAREGRVRITTVFVSLLNSQAGDEMCFYFAHSPQGLEGCSYACFMR